jgi:uncharacterized DUF497 family protein
MVEESFEQALARVDNFDWNPIKRAITFKERGIDFDDMRHVLAGDFLTQRSDRNGEVRHMVFGFLADVEVVYVCTFRDTVCWIMSARRARRDEREKYHARITRRLSQDQK